MTKTEVSQKIESEKGHEQSERHILLFHDNFTTPTSLLSTKTPPMKILIATLTEDKPMVFEKRGSGCQEKPNNYFLGTFVLPVF